MMRALFFILFLYLPFSALAAEDPQKTASTPSSSVPAPASPEQEKNKILIIDGKKFFPIGNARRFYGSAKPMPVSASPIRLSHPYAGTLHKNPLPMAKPSEDNTRKDSAPASPSTASDVLSLFAPEEKAPTK